jgi:hypothetical protein
MASDPLVSIVMNCFDGAKYLHQAIDSVTSQTYENWELIFWDNQSTDESASIVKSYNHARIKYFYADSHTFLSEARNNALVHCKGEIVAFLDVDDWWLPGKLKSQIPFFEDPEVGLSCTNFWIFNETVSNKSLAYKTSKPSGHVLGNLLDSYSVGLLTLLIRRSVLSSGGKPFNPGFHIIGDFDLVIRLSTTWKLARSHEPLATYRTHGANESLKHPKRLISEMENWIESNRENPIIGKNPSFKMVSANLNYNLGMAALRVGRFSEALTAFRKIKVLKKKLQLIIAMTIPLELLNKIRP